MVEVSNAGSTSNLNTCKIKFEWSREPIHSGKCLKFDNWLKVILSPDNYLTIRDNQDSVPEEGLQDYFDLDAYHAALKKYSIKIRKKRK